MKIIVISALIFVSFAASCLASASDTAWTVTLPENEYVTGALFSNDDSLLITFINYVKSNDHEPDTGYISIRNPYNGQELSRLKEKMNAGYVRYGALKPNSNLWYLGFDHHFDSLFNRIPDRRILIYDIKSGLIIDSIQSLNNEPDLNIDTSYILYTEFTPDGSRLFMTINIFDDFIQPKYILKVIVWNTSNWTVERKISLRYSTATSIAPNNRYYWENNTNPVHREFFKDINNDTTMLELMDNDSIEYREVIFPKIDTNKFLVKYFDKKDYRNKIQVRSQTDFSVIKTIVNDTLQNYYDLNFVGDSRYLIFSSGNNNILLSHNIIYDIENEMVVYVYPEIYYHWLGNYGASFLVVSNNSELIFDGGKRQNYMLNAKYTTTSTKESDKESPGLIFPNPATDYIEINVGAQGTVPDDVSIFDVLGMEINNSTLTPTLSLKGEGVRIDISLLPPGVYFVRIGDVVRKFVKL